MTAARETIRVVIPLAIKRRNGRPRILPPEDTGAADRAPTQDAHLARAWNWRRKLERGEVTTIEDIAAMEKVTGLLRPAYLSPIVLEKLLLHRRACAPSIKDLMVAAELPWAEQEKVAFGE